MTMKAKSSKLLDEEQRLLAMIQAAKTPKVGRSDEACLGTPHYYIIKHMHIVCYTVGLGFFFFFLFIYVSI